MIDSILDYERYISYDKINEKRLILILFKTLMKAKNLTFLDTTLTIFFSVLSKNCCKMKGVYHFDFFQIRPTNVCFGQDLPKF